MNKRTRLAGATVVAVAAAGLGLGACGGTAPAASPPVHTQAPAPVHSAPARPKPPPAPKAAAQTFTFSGSGDWNSPSFPVGSTVTLRYSYWNNTMGNGDGGDNFIADLVSNSDDQSIVNAIAVSGGTTTTIYPNTSFGGSDVYHLSVTATGPWSFTLTTTPPAGSPKIPSVAAPGAQAPAQAAPAPPAQQQDAWSVVQQYYADINAGNYQGAWALTGNGNLGNSSYGAFVAGYSLTKSVTVSENWESGDTCSVNITALAYSGSAPGSPLVTQTFTGTYTVDNGIITGADVTQTS